MAAPPASEETRSASDPKGQAGAATAAADGEASAPPVHPELAEAEAAFERGDYAQVRALAGPLAKGDGPVAAGARDLLRRVRVDPAQVGVLLACLLFFLFIVWKYVS